MSVRKVKPYGNSDFIQKTIDIDRKLPLIQSLSDLNGYEKEFNRWEYLSIYQSLAEAELWNDCSWEERELLSPLVQFYFDNYNRPVLVYPRFEPLAQENESFRFEEEECLSALHLRLARKGMADEEIGSFIERIIALCEDYDLDETDILYNLNNLGWNPIFGARIIDFGLNNEAVKKFYWKKKEDENEV